MSIASALGLTSGQVRYAFVGLGDIAQEAMLPGVAHTGNSKIAAFVSGDTAKSEALCKRYDVDYACDYDGFDALLRSGRIDAIYLATPNWRHAEFVVPALRAGIHVLCEKPIEISSAKGLEILAAERESTAKLMIAYRLHFEPATLDAIDRIRDGELGELIMATSVFAQMVDPANHRAHSGALAGPLLDMAPYPINAMRYLFGEEPVEVVSAVATRHPAAGFADDVDDTVAVTLRFPEDRIGQFVVSYYANSVGRLTVAGTKGSIQLDPAFTFGEGLEQFRTIGKKKSHEAFKATDQFGGQMKYFSACILDDQAPEPGAEEGLADLRVIEGVMRALETRQPQALAPFVRSRRIDTRAQKQTLSMVDAPEPIDAASPARDS